eukprot:TRINITY_DN4440_c0_g1_i1.p1 TRINITY_DN4440_c0_g1~~TRINITY_DN4440_c0_g1_i1.p1  ORF type:complete len:230 (-),score=46.25 TRINITY_DN4440_c0_g1_i1:277-966(-)
MENNHEFVQKGALEKRINSEEDLQLFLRSNVLHQYLSFLEGLNESVMRKELGLDCHRSDVVNGLLSVFERLDQLIDETPPTEQPTRFGNKAYRTWLDIVISRSEEYMLMILPEEFHSAAGELASYWDISFGNRTRIDYGTGHETNFFAFLFCLDKLGLIQDVDRYAIVALIFNRYLSIVRKIQRLYWLEPAGSHGVWSLDDYQILPFYFGASQLIGLWVSFPYLRSPIL